MSDIPELLDHNTLDNLRSLLDDGLDEVLEEYLKDSENTVEALGAAAEKQDNDALVMLAHTLKGSSGSVGANRLYRICEALEKDGRAGTLTDPVARVELVRQEHRQTTEALSSLIRR